MKGQKVSQAAKSAVLRNVLDLAFIKQELCVLKNERKTIIVRCVNKKVEEDLAFSIHNVNL